MNEYLDADITQSITGKDLGTFLSKATLQKYAKLVQNMQVVVKNMADVSFNIQFI